MNPIPEIGFRVPSWVWERESSWNPWARSKEDLDVTGLDLLIEIPARR